MSQARPRAKVAILYGVVGGPHSQVRLLRGLRAAGYTVVSGPAKADIIIAHSAGCLWLPESETDQTLLLVGPPYWPGKTIRQSAKERSRNNFRFREYGYPFRRWFIRNLWGIYYLIFEARRTRYIIRHMAEFNLEQVVQAHDVTIVRNNDDEWLTPDLEHLTELNSRTQIIR
ncbi:MAG TPA: hypothetical protein VLF59_06145, partial [Candidatus Saccharimonadales bacterium]|nr:hypothetical protein [Candidatus Saccharimonadales bacterium]